MAIIPRFILSMKDELDIFGKPIYTPETKPDHMKMELEYSTAA